MNPLQFFNPLREVFRTGNRLPHWQQEGVVYFVTFRLVDSLPWELTSRWNSERNAWMEHHPFPWSSQVEGEYRKRFLEPWENGLDQGNGECLLRKSECAKLVMDALQFFDGTRSALLSAVVMPNHVHALFVVPPEEDLGKLLQSWKRFSSRQINELLGRAGSIWQKDYFDRVVRDASHFRNCVRYIRKNPERGHLKAGEFLLFESELAKDVE